MITRVMQSTHKVKLCYKNNELFPTFKALEYSRRWQERQPIQLLVMLSHFSKTWRGQTLNLLPYSLCKLHASQHFALHLKK
jgi:hypothetical protein